MLAKIKLTILSVAAATLVLGLSACGKKDSKPAATQVAAKVGSVEITVYEINQVLQRTNTSGMSPAATKNLGAEVLEKLIDQQLAVDQAMEANLNRTADVIAQTEAARREILARAYMQKLAGSLPKPTAEDAKKYFLEHPQLFSERRIFNVQELVVPKAAGAKHADVLRGYISAGKTIEEAAVALKLAGIDFSGGGVTRAAEQIPLEMLAKLSDVKDGQSIVFDNPQSATLLRVVSTQLSPLSEADALPRIGQFLVNLQAAEAVTTDIKRLRVSNPVTYMGDFAKTGADTPVVAEENMLLAPVSAAKSAIERGVAGLK